MRQLLRFQLLDDTRDKKPSFAAMSLTIPQEIDLFKYWHMPTVQHQQTSYKRCTEIENSWKLPEITGAPMRGILPRSYKPNIAIPFGLDCKPRPAP